MAKLNLSLFPLLIPALCLLFTLAGAPLLAQNDATPDEAQNQDTAASASSDAAAGTAPDNTATAAEKSSEETDIEGSMTDIRLMQQALESLQRELEASKATSTLNKSSVETVQEGFKLIEDKLQDTYNKLDESRSSISTSIENLNQLKQDLESTSRATRTNTAELGSQKSLIEDNAVRLYELLIQTNLIDEKTTGLYTVIENNKQSEKNSELQLVTDAELASLRALLSTVIVFFTPLAFTLAGRANENRVLADNVNQQQAALPVCLVAVVGYIMLGFGLMYGATQSGWLGTSSYLFSNETVEATGLGLNVPFADFQLYQNGFIFLASLIVYMIVGRQLSSAAHIILALFVGVVLIPVFGHWVWSGNFVAGNKGWLETMGFIDQAGSSVVNLVAASFALTIAWKLGNTLPPPQPTGSTQDTKTPVYSSTAVIFLWLSWLGLTTGNVSIAEGQLSDVLLNVNIAASMGGIMAFLYYAFFNTDRSDMTSGISGFVSGLVAIAASVQTVSAAEAAVIGAIAGILQNISCNFIRRFFLKQEWQRWAVYLVAIHGAGGIWGTLCVALFGTEGNFSAPDITQLLTQLQGVGAAIIYSVIVANIMIYLLRFRGKTRQPETEPGVVG